MHLSTQLWLFPNGKPSENLTESFPHQTEQRTYVICFASLKASAYVCHPILSLASLCYTPRVPFVLTTASARLIQLILVFHPLDLSFDLIGLSPRARASRRAFFSASTTEFFASFFSAVYCYLLDSAFFSSVFAASDFASVALSALDLVYVEAFVAFSEVLDSSSLARAYFMDVTIWNWEKQQGLWNI